MSTSEFDRAVNFLQGALNAAALRFREEPQGAEPMAARTSASTDPHAGEPCLPGFEPDTDSAAEPSRVEPTDAPRQPAADPADPVARCEADREPESPTEPVACPADGGLRIGRLAVCAILAASAGVAVVAAHKLIRPRTVVQVVEKEIQVEPDGIPLALLPETAEADAWDVVANMSGEINGTNLSFRRGIARADGKEYRVCLDFCRSGNDVYARVEGNGSWIVRIAPNGRILKAYRAPKVGKPLRSLFAR